MKLKASTRPRAITYGITLMLLLMAFVLSAVSCDSLSDITDNTPTQDTPATSHTHTVVTDPAVAPTCTESGLTEGSHCSVCNEILTAQETVPATGHSYNLVWVYNDSMHWKECSVCHAKTEEAAHILQNKKCTVCNFMSGSEGLAFTSNGDGTCYVSGIGSCVDTDIVIPLVSPAGDNVTSIGSSVFRGCSSLTSITIPSGVKNIGSCAFYNCSNLATVTFAENSQCSSIGDDAFYNCSNLKAVYITDLAAWCGIEFGSSSSNPLIYAKNLYINGELAKDITIPSGVTSIGDYAFYDCSSLTSITIPSGVKNIGSYAFYDCSNLATVTFAENSQCSSIGSSAFYDCSSLTSITIPSSVTSIGYEAFSRCSSLESITVDSTNKVYHSAGNCLIETGTKTLIAGCKASVIPTDGTVTSIGEDAFDGCSSLKSITIPSSVKNIGNEAFYNCSNLKTVTFAEGSECESIGKSAFRDCSNLNAVYITDLVAWCGIKFEGYDSNPLGYAHNLYINGELATDITIPSSVTSIGRYAFSGCSSLESITLPFVGATKDGTEDTHFGYIFGASSYSYNSSYVPSSLKTVVITGGTSIGDHAFSGCSSLESITIPTSVKNIGDYAFYYCSNLATVTFAENSQCSSIGYDAFHGCSSLTSITIPSSVKNIGNYAFSYCSNLVTVTFAENSQCSSIGSYAFEYCYKLIEVCNKSSLTIVARSSDNGYIGNYAKHIITDEKDSYLSEKDGYIFYDDGTEAYLMGYNSSATELILPEKMPNGKDYAIYQYAFKYCRSLTSITIPSGVKNIGSYAFYECFNLATVTFAENSQCSSIGSSAFSWCSSLTSITIPSSVTSIGSDAFRNCSRLESITLPFVGATKGGTSNTHFGYIFGASSYLNNSSYVPSSLKTVVITGGTSIGDWAFYGCNNLKSITIPSSVTSIGSSAFQYCSSFERITVDPANSVYHSAGNCIIETATKTLIAGCKTSLIPDDGTVTSIGSSAFLGCSSLTSITIPSSVTSIDIFAFLQCSSLESITVDSANKVYHSAGNCLIKTGTKTLVVGCKASVIPADGTVTSIGSYAFFSCSSLESITIPSSVKNIGSDAFYDCSNLATVTFAENSQCESIGSDAFRGCSSLTSITIPSSVKNIESCAFYNCSSLTSITIPSGVTSIGSYAFQYCSSLERITVDPANPIYHSAGNCIIETATKTLIAGCKASVIPADGTVTSIGNNAFSGCESLTSITIPSGVKNIGRDAFYDCSNLATVTFAENSQCSSIGDYAFAYCSSLTSITIPSSVTSIGEGAFGCSSLESITIPSSVTSIGNYAFEYCSSLTSINFQGTMEQWNAISKGNGWNSSTGAYTIHCTDGDM